jgi:phosphoesterase RecJ-like protein
MQLNKEDIQGFQEILSTKPRTIIINHANPDGDCIGASSGLRMGLESLGIPVRSLSIDPVPDKYRFVKDTSKFQHDFAEDSFDLVIFVDCGNKKMTKFHETKPIIFDKTKVKIINIDHHKTDDFFGTINFIKTSSPSTTAIVYTLLKALKIEITKDIATALMLGLYTDTGGFRHQNSTEVAFHIAGALRQAGADIQKIDREVFRTYKPETLKLWGEVLGNLHLTEDGAVIVGVKKQNYQHLGSRREDLEGVIDYINSIPEARYSVLLSEDEHGNVKASLRTRKPDVDVQALAAKFGGGGHVKAAGFTIKNGLLKKEVKWKIEQS